MTIGPSAIRVNAVLSAFRDDEDSDVVDALCYFFVPILDRASGTPMTGSLLAKASGFVYGWNLTESVGELFLQRLVVLDFIRVEGKDKDKRFIAQASAEMSNSIDAKIQVAFDDVTKRFEEFELISGDSNYRNLSREELGDMLVRFLISLDAYTNEAIAVELRGAAKNGELAALKQLQSDASVLSRAETHVCARFVQQLSADDPILAENLSLFVSAGLLAELVEDFRKPSTVKTKSNTIFFLDGPMLLGLIGTSGAALQTEARTIVDALKSIGCQVQTLSESCLEAERVLSAYLKSTPSERYGRTHTAVLKGEVDRQFVQTVSADVEVAAEKFGVKVRDYQLDTFPNLHKYFEHEQTTDIDSFLAWENPRAREHDAYAVTAIMRMRQGKHRNDPLDNSHVFISSNVKLARKSRKYCLDSRLIRETQCGPVVDTRDLATIAWLRTGFENSDKLPISHMLAQCERVLRVRKDVVESARLQVAKFTPDKKEEFELLLQSNRAVDFLIDSSRGSASTFDVSQDQQLLDGMLDAAIRVVMEDTKRQVTEIKKELTDKNVAFDVEKVKLLAQLKEVKESEKKASQELTKVNAAYQSIMLKGKLRANAWVTFIQWVAGFALLFLGVSAAFAIIGDALPAWADYGAKIFGIYGIFTVIQAFRGKSIWGLSHLSSWFSQRVFLNYCTSRGVPLEVTRSRLTVDNGRVYLTNQKDIESE